MRGKTEGEEGPEGRGKENSIFTFINCDLNHSKYNDDICRFVQEKDKPNSTTMNGSPGGLSGLGTDQMGVKLEPTETDSHSMLGSSSSSTSIVCHNGIKPVSPEQEELIHRLVYFQTEYEQPSGDDLKRIKVRTSEPRVVRW